MRNEQDMRKRMLDNATLDPRILRNAFGTFATGVTVVTMLDGDGCPTGVTVNSFASLSLDPALCLFSLGRNQVSRSWIDQGSPFIINVLAAAQEDVAWAFAKPRADKFDGIASNPGKAVEVPAIAGTLGRFECRLWQKYDGGDHDLIIGEVLHVEHGEGEPLLFFRGAMAGLVN